jgi:hypothetical protein
MKFPWFSRASRAESRRTKLARRPQAFRPAVEPLESREVLSTAYVVPMAQPVDAAHFHSLFAAMPAAGAGGTVVVEPGATPDSGSVSVTLAGLTLQGDPNVPGSILPRYDLNVNASGVALDNLNLGSVTVTPTASGVAVTRSQLLNFTETGAVSGAGHNVLSQNVITGAVDLQGNSGLSQQTGDLVEHNTFASAAPVIVKLTNSSGTVVRDNTFAGDASSQVGIQVRSNSDGVVIAGNRVELTGAGQPFAVVLINTGGAAGNLLSARVADNVLSTGGKGTGLLVNIFGTGAGLTVQAEGNEFHGNKVGVDVNGIAGATGAGNVDLGGGLNAFGVSRGGNNFRGYDGQNGHYAINLHNTDAGAGVAARRNVFDVGANPAAVVRSGANGGGTGMVSVSDALDADHAFVQNLFTKVLGRTGNPAAGSDLDAWVAYLPSLGRGGVANGILRSTESLTRIVGGYYLTYLGRTTDAASLAGWVGAIQNGMPLEQVQSGILSSPEFLSRVNTDYVQALYLNVLHRTGSGADLASWHALVPQLGLQGVAAGFTGSQEHRAAVAGDYFRDLLHREPGAGGAEAWAAQPIDLLGIEVGILSSSEFYMNG